MGGDAVGTFHGGLSSSCFNEAGDLPVPDHFVSVEHIALSELDTPVELSMDGIPNGAYVLNGFIDDVPSYVDGADIRDVRPGVGDLVSFGDVGPSCTDVVIDGADASVDFDLNLVMNFEL